MMEDAADATASVGCAAHRAWPTSIHAPTTPPDVAISDIGHCKRLDAQARYIQKPSNLFKRIRVLLPVRFLRATIPYFSPLIILSCRQSIKQASSTPLINSLSDTDETRSVKSRNMLYSDFDM